MRLILLAACAAALAGCSTTGSVVETKWRTVTVTKRGPCPEPSVYATLKASRPTPLRQQKRPASGVERNARTQAQLGLYEAEGAWADKVSAALDRCQIESEHTEQQEGKVDAPR